MSPRPHNWSERLGCRVRCLQYDFDRRCGKLKLPGGSNPDLLGVQDLFIDIDPKVETVDVFVDGVLYASAVVERVAKPPSELQQ
jgi:hypothetical protein